MSGQGCIDGSTQDNFPALFEEKIVKARKLHRCCECHEPIEIGERYQNAHGLWDGEWDTFYTCLPCSRIRADLLCSWEYGTLQEVLADVFFDTDDPDTSWIMGAKP